jgi:CO/xanthine dehydrogenase FAD-binding subunit
MIIEYHRPVRLDEALSLLARTQPLTLPLGGGTVLSRRRKPDFAVVDLQNLGLNTIEKDGQLLTIGAMVTLEQLFSSNHLPESLGEALRESLRLEGGLNQRQSATVAGCVVACDGRSPFVTALLALDPRLVWAGSEEAQPLGDFLPLREEGGSGKLITAVKVPLNAALRFTAVARTPVDRPIVCAAVAVWPSGRTRVTLGGCGKAPILAMDGPEPGGADASAREAFRSAGDEWASAEYRVVVAGTLVRRLAGQPKGGSAQ